MPVRPEVVDDWVRGWTVSRGTSAPVAVPDGYRIDVGRPGHLVRYVVPRFDPERLRRLAGSLTGPGTWLKLFADPADVLAALPDGWKEDAPCFMMTAALRTAEIAPPDGYSLSVVEENGVLRAVVRARNGDLAARGQAGLAGEAAVMDQVETDPAHRRRGLGGLVMTALGHGAALRGVGRGVLGATVEGRALYLSLGWEEHCPLVSVYRP
ncbi:hypothetical protein GCM10009678_06450 [Actinomadura kijaniata]|uniref:GNAT superfamily N-acetyltransferase n=1 Tax=Actinomadura namibiensis TaxID=182080 RepID=A0A7W3LLM5_ACTNM|nr:GNAT family N-acetyltransferase [Actinomadura namibiensis]MBA8950389.1 GNAT superfamily N-acetyltransferase [Actinomadura namibiensis]